MTPVTFRVRRHNSRGILAKCDAQEDGSRELSGEWVVGRKLWQRLQADWKRDQKSPSIVEKIKDRQKERVLLYLHGGVWNIIAFTSITDRNPYAGAYYLSSAAAQRLLSIPLSKYTDSRVFGNVPKLVSHRLLLY